MVLYITDRNGYVIQTCASDLPNNNLIVEDTLTDDLKSGVKTFECTLIATEAIKESAKCGNYIMVYGSLYTIINSSFNTESGTVSLYCEDCGLDFINRIVDKVDKTTKTFKNWIIATLGTETVSGWKYNFNIPNRSKELEFTSESTATERLLSILDNYYAEMYFTYEIDGFNWVQRTINFVEKRGTSIDPKKLYINKEVVGITKQEDVSQLATVWKVYGKDNKKLSALTGYSSIDKTVRKNGYTFKIDGDEIRCQEAMAKWISKLDKDGVIKQVKRLDFDTAQSAVSFAIEEMLKVVEPIITYEVTLSNLEEDIECGDYIYVLDDLDNILLKSRVLNIIKKSVDKSVEITLGEFTEVKSSIETSVVVSGGGTSAYESAIAGGMDSSITEEEFNASLGSIPNLSDINNTITSTDESIDIIKDDAGISIEPNQITIGITNSGNTTVIDEYQLITHSMYVDELNLDKYRFTVDWRGLCLEVLADG